MKTIFLLIVLCISVLKMDAQSITQEVIATSGDSYSNSSAMLSFTVGEPVAETFSTTNNSITQGFQQSSLTFWTGTISTVWENALNWNPAILPDINADVIILSFMPRYPVISSHLFCATATMQPGAIITINAGFTLAVKGH